MPVQDTAIETAAPGVSALDAAQRADIEKFEVQLGRYLTGDLAEDAFRVFRLNNGIYGQRQGGHHQMVRVKLPYGAVSPEQLETLGALADEYSRGWGHITTRQNIQFHFVQLERIPALLRELAKVGLTSREACGDTVRNVQGCHLAGACPYEQLDISAWAEATHRWFLRNPLSQRLPRKFKINFSGCATDCGQAMFNDVGVIGVTRRLDDGTTVAGFRVFVAGGLGANPHPALALEPFTARADLMSTLEACLRVFANHGNRDNKLRARMKWLVDTLGWDDVQARILKERAFLVASATWPGGVPELVESLGDAPAGRTEVGEVTPMGQGIVPVAIRATRAYDRWEQANVVRGVAKGTVSAYAWSRLGDVTSNQFRALAAISRELTAEVRVTNRQNLVYRGLGEEQLPVLHERLAAIAMAEPGAELARDVVACPGADTCNLAVTQSRGLADAIGEALEDAGLADVGGVRTNISGCTNSCGQHHTADVGFFGAERRANGRSAPGYQLLLGGYVGEEQIHFGQKALRLPAKAAPEAAVRVIRRYAEERTAGETFKTWLERVGGASEVAAGLTDLGTFPAYEDRPDYYVDYDETGPYEAVTGASECAT